MASRKKEVIGFVDFVDTTTEKRITSVPLYSGESIKSADLLPRALRVLKATRKLAGAASKAVLPENILARASRVFSPHGYRI